MHCINFSLKPKFSLQFYTEFKQKTAYEVRLSLVGSEMCIRDSFARSQKHIYLGNPTQTLSFSCVAIAIL